MEDQLFQKNDFRMKLNLKAQKGTSLVQIDQVSGREGKNPAQLRVI